MITRRAAKGLLAGIAAVLAILVLACAAAGLWIRGRMQASLPVLEGATELRGLGAKARVVRDALGVPTVTASNRADVARVTGWVHAQDRFFQMDTLRRRGAGELSELFGKDALAYDREARLHGFRELAQKALARETPERRAILEAYAQGVNAGLAALHGKPWEYYVLQSEPRPWSPVDTFLVSYAMTLDLQEGTGHYIRTLDAIRSELGDRALAFFAPEGTSRDVPIDASSWKDAPLPPASDVDLRSRDQAAARLEGKGPWSDRLEPGSNSFAVAAKVAGAGALLANDMHLHLGVPNIWYRMSLKWPGHDETGVTLPGTPTLVAGSTGRIAWGFTNSNTGTGDIILVNPTASPELYHGPNDQLLRIENRTEVVAVKGSKPVTLEFRWTVWGPVVGEEPGGKLMVFHWTADAPEATNMAIIDLEDAADTPEAVDIAHRLGITVQNFVVADSRGRIGWTVAGFLPHRVGYDGRLPVSWDFGDRRWEGFLKPSEVPTIIDPESGLLWTANNRTVGGAALAALGDGGYDIAARAAQIRGDLFSLAQSGRSIGPKDLLAIQLDDRAVLLAGWHARLLETLTPEVVSGKSSRAEILAAARKWEGRASVDSVSYRIVRSFRLAVAHRVFDPIFAPCRDRDPDFSWTKLNYEQPLETIIASRPAHLLDPQFATWQDLMVAAVDDVSAGLKKQGVAPADATWGRANTTRIEHPFARSLPRWATSWLRMPAGPLPGDSNMPRIQSPSFGASERFVVSPGRESEGIFHMPGAACANPMSPYFRSGYEAWARGDATPFLPGPPEHTLELAP